MPLAILAISCCSLADRTGISVLEALRLRSLRGAKLVAGEAGAARSIRYVNVMEVPDILPYVREHELLLTTGYPLRERATALEALLPRLAERQLAGLAIVPRPYLGVLPAAVLAAADGLAFPLIELPDNTSFNEIMSEVLELILNRQAVELERSRRIHERLTAVVLGGGSFAELTRTLADLLGKPAAIVDAHGRVLAASDSTSDARNAPAGAWAVRPIRVGGAALGEIVIRAPESEVMTDDLIVADQAATIAALLMVQARAVMTREQRYRAVVLDELVSGHPTRKDEIVEHAAALGWDLQIQRAAVLVDLETPDSRELLVAGQPLEERLLLAVRSALGPEAIAWGRRSGLAALVPVAGRADHLEQARRLRVELASAVPGAVVSVGVGRVYPDVLDLQASYREAAQALTIGRDIEGRGSVVSFDELGLYRLLHPLSRGTELERYCDDLLGPLVRYDREHDGRLLATLECYLRNDRNVAAAARELSIHYNTLRYRLEKIDLLTGGLDRHGLRRLSLEVALQARRLALAQGAYRERPALEGPPA